MREAYLPRELPVVLSSLTDLALDLRWTWSHGADELWRRLAPSLWEQSENPWLLLQDVDEAALERAAADPDWMRRLGEVQLERRRHLEDPGWFGRTHAGGPLRRVAYFSMEFGLGEALPLYAGGLGVLAGDFLKGASDLGVPGVGVGLLYQEGYFRQMIDAAGDQVEVYPFDDPLSLPVQPALSPAGGWMHVKLEFPGRLLHLRVWQATVGRVLLLLLDSNDPLNAPADRGITGKLYGGGQEVRLLQELVLGIGGWRAVEALGLDPEVLHLNEGHAALALVERARRYGERHGLSFPEALWATRASNVFTTHTPVPAGMDRYPVELVRRYEPYFRTYVAAIGMTLPQMLALGRRDPDDAEEPFNMAYLALRGCGRTNAVSRLHERTSRRIFQELFPRWPEREIPITHVTNGVHVPTWDAPAADRLWSARCGTERWRHPPDATLEEIGGATDEELWRLRGECRQALVAYLRRRAARQLGFRGADAAAIERTATVMDANALTLGFARRITPYKRPTLVLRDRERLVRLLTSADRPVQLVVAGKAHPADEVGRAMVREWTRFARDPRVESRVIFVEDYDMAVAQELVRGVDVWINTPRPPMEASGTSGMKVLANGGVNLSSLDGWWAEAYEPEVGWALGAPGEPAADDADAERLYRLLEDEIVPEFFDRDEGGLPRRWIARMRASMSRLAPRFSTGRMVREYVEALYVPAAVELGRRGADGAALARELRAWAARLECCWRQIHFGSCQATAGEAGLCFAVQVFLGDVRPDDVAVELFSDPAGDDPGVCVPMERAAEIPGAANGAVYRALVATRRPARDFTPRVVPFHPDALVPVECPLIAWRE